MQAFGLRYSLLPGESQHTLSRDCDSELDSQEQMPVRISLARENRGGIKELACGGQAFIATSLFDSSMSALPTPILHKG